MDNVLNCDSFTNIPPSQTYRSYFSKMLLTTLRKNLESKSVKLCESCGLRGGNIVWYVAQYDRPLSMFRKSLISACSGLSNERDENVGVKIDEVPPKCWSRSTRLCDVTPQETIILNYVCNPLTVYLF
jgi:hypothetical protein